MREFIKRLKIRVKLLFAFGSIILLSVFLTLFAITSIDKIIAYKNLNATLDELIILLNKIDGRAKEFTYEGYKSDDFQTAGNSLLVAELNHYIDLSQTTLYQISTSSLLSASAKEQVSSMIKRYEAFKSVFHQTEELLAKRGFKDYGLEGSLREAIHSIEKSESPYDKVLMLTLRRHEKDFFLRKDLKYQNEFNKIVADFNTTLLVAGSTDLLGMLQNYQKQFNQVVDIEKQLGLTDYDGIKGELYSELKVQTEETEAFQNYLKAINEAQISSAKLLLIFTFLAQLILAVVLAILYSNVLTSVIKQIRYTMQQLAKGTFPQALPIRTTDEIGQTKMAINTFLERLKVATGFAQRLGDGELTAEYDNRFRDDVLAKGIISMQSRLQIADAEQKKINWNNEGAARFGEILKNDDIDLQSLGDRILKFMTHYLNANQAALYLANDQEEVFYRISTYAYGKKKFQENKINYGTGLIGQCALEKEIIFLKEIPNDYIKITSGLGDATPRNLMIVPLLVHDDVKGVLELASFEIFETHTIDFVRKMGENIAAVLSNRQITDTTKKLLKESESKANVLAQQEEEMRQNAEELQATQEEMERQRIELLNEIEKLKAEIKKEKMRNKQLV